jgi:hypothetical protein
VRPVAEERAMLLSRAAKQSARSGQPAQIWMHQTQSRQDAKTQGVLGRLFCAFASWRSTLSAWLRIDASRVWPQGQPCACHIGVPPYEREQLTASHRCGALVFNLPFPIRPPCQLALSLLTAGCLAGWPHRATALHARPPPSPAPPGAGGRLRRRFIPGAGVGKVPRQFGREPRAVCGGRAGCEERHQAGRMVWSAAGRG